MIRGKSVLALIPARGESKGVPRKNIRVVAGKPLMAWTIAEAKKSKYIDRLVLSSEDREIIEVAQNWGCDVPFIRPSELAQDETPGIEPVLHAIKMLPGYDYIVLLQPTSPLRTVEDIDGCIEKCVKHSANACVSVTVPKESPYWMYTFNSGENLRPLIENSPWLTRRQDLPKTVVLNGAVYVAGCEWLQENKAFLTEDTIGFEMPPRRSIDIDTEFDMFVLEQVVNNEGKYE